MRIEQQTLLFLERQVALTPAGRKLRRRAAKGLKMADVYGLAPDLGKYATNDLRVKIKHGDRLVKVLVAPESTMRWEALEPEVLAKLTGGEKPRPPKAKTVEVEVVLAYGDERDGIGLLLTDLSQQLPGVKKFPPASSLVEFATLNRKHLPYVVNWTTEHLR